MNYVSHGKSGRRPGLLIALCVVAFAIVPAVAQANVTPTVSATYGSTMPGDHANYTVTHNYAYTGLPSALGSSGDDLRRYVIDSPAGLVGNPNAVPFADRCTSAQFNQVNPLVAPTCPATSIVGSATLQLDDDSGLVPGGGIPLLSGTIYLLQTEPDVPTTLATSITASGNSPGTCGTTGTTFTAYIKTKSVISPWSNGDYRLRTVSQEDSNRPVISYNTGGTCLYGNVQTITQTLFGQVPSSGADFLTNPTRCDSWDTYLYGKAHDTNSNVDADPNETGTNDFKVSATHSVTPDCATKAAFNPSATSVFSTNKRDTSPVGAFTVDLAGVPGVGVPKTLVTTLPKTVSVNGAAIPITCKVAERAAKACPAGSKVGTVAVETPLIAGGLPGDVFAVENPAGQVPNLAIHVKDDTAGGLEFWIDSSNQLVGGQVITTFDNLPQVGFTKFALRIDAGSTGFLKIRRCPDSSARPPDGSITHQFTDYAGQTATVVNATTFAECVRVIVRKPPRCVARSLDLQPNYAARANVDKAELFIDGHRVATTRKQPLKFSIDADLIDEGKHTTKVRAFYDSGRKAYDKSSFTRC